MTSGNAPFDVSYREELKDKRGKNAKVQEKALHATGGTSRLSRFNKRYTRARARTSTSLERRTAIAREKQKAKR
jgi:hypothetical protein